MRRTSIFLALLTAVFLLSLNGTAWSTSEQSPTDSVKSTLSELLRIIGNQHLSDPGRIEERRAQIERLLRERISYADMAKRSLGNPWTDLDEAEQREFTELFIRFLARSLAEWKLERDLFADGRSELSADHVTFLFEQQKEQLSCVRTRVRGYKVDTLVDFHLVNRLGHWRIYDVAVDHMSVTGNYRSQFARIMQSISLTELEEKIRKTLPILRLFEIITPR